LPWLSIVAVGCNQRWIALFVGDRISEMIDCYLAGDLATAKRGHHPQANAVLFHWPD